MPKDRARVVLGTVMALVVTGCATASSSTPGASTSGASASATAAPSIPQRTLVIGVRGEMPSAAALPLVPMGALSQPTWLFNANLDYPDEHGIPRAYLALSLPSLSDGSWKVFPDGTMQTSYKLRPNLTWHDGVPLTAEDFAFAFKVYSDPQFGVSGPPPVGAMSEVDAPDPQSIIIKWKQINADGGAMAQYFQALPEHILATQYQTLDPSAFVDLPFWTQDYIGLGPYAIADWEPGAHVDGMAFDHYVFGQPKIDHIQLVYFSDPNAGIAAMLAGTVQYVGAFVFSETDGITLEDQWTLTHGGTVLYSPVLLRLTQIQVRPEVADPVTLRDPRMRRALAYSIDSANADVILAAGKGLVTSTLTSPLEPYYPQIAAVIENHAYNPQMAQQLLEDVGYSKGPNGMFQDSNGKPLTIGMWASSGDKNEREEAVYVDSLNRTGIGSTTNVFSAAQLADSQARALIPGLGIRGLGSKRIEVYTSEQVPTPENRWKGENRGGWNSPAYDQLFNAYSTTLESTQRIQALVQMEALFSEQEPGIPHYFQAEVTPFASGLAGPVERFTPESEDSYLHVEQWHWAS